MKLLILLSICACSHQLNEELNDELSQFAKPKDKNIPINKKNSPSVKRSSEEAMKLNM